MQRSRDGPAQKWLVEQDPAELAICEWILTGTSSALSIKLRAELLTLEQRAAALSTFNRLAAESFTVLPVTGGHFRAAAKFVDQHTLGLRAGDALHLATASEHGATVHPRPATGRCGSVTGRADAAADMIRRLSSLAGAADGG